MPDFAIEVSCPRNEYWIFPPTGARLRGHFSSSKVAHINKSSEALKKLFFSIAEIPGMVVRVNTDKMTGEIVDPLEVTPEGRNTLRTINEIFKSHGEAFGESKAWPTQKIDLTPDTLKDWLFWMRRGLDAKYAVPAGGTPLPPLDEIRALPGRRVADPLYSGQCSLESPDPRAQYGIYKWADEVPVGAELATAGASRGGRKGEAKQNAPAGNAGASNTGGDTPLV